MPKRKRQRRNFGHFVLSLQDKTIPRGMFANYFLKCLLNSSPKLARDEITCILKHTKKFLFFLAQFVELVQKFKLKLSTSLIEAIMNVFEGPKNTVDQGLLKSFYLEEYPATKLPLVSRKKGILKTKETKENNKNEATKKNVKNTRNAKTNMRK